ncbi:MAG: esterase-like activity of phytase family protein [Hyphomonadaceae bacterium]|nr:esterase-like activity of phytase family protein [Hyphomonadaceae bacterium]
MRSAFIAVLLLAACANGDAPRPPAETTAADARPVAGFGPAPQDWQAVRLAVRATPLAPDAPDLAAVGALTFRGGLALSSDDARFGGLSGLYVAEDGNLLAVTDQGDWFAARIVLDAQGALKGLVDGRMSALRGPDGAPLTDKALADAEGLARLPDGRFAVTFERIHAVRLYDLDGLGPTAAPVGAVALDGTDALTANDSLEAVAAFDDRLLIGAEGVDRPRAPFWLAPLADPAPAAPAGRTETSARYGLVALDRLPDGDFLAMERFFAPLIGPRIAIVRVSAARLLETPAQWTRETVAELNPPVALDNFEGLAVTRGPAGGVRIYIVSDDNFSRTQRTLLYAFDLDDPR